MTQKNEWKKIMYELIDKLYSNNALSKEELIVLISKFDKDDSEYLASKAKSTAQKFYENKVFVRGLIEFSNFCKNDCYYCGIRKSNLNANRYRLSKEDILSCCKQGYELGFRTFVLQGGEDLWYSDEKLVDIISSIREAYKDCAITLSLGEKSHEQYEKYHNAGADRYLLRHETADEEHFRKLHPKELSGKMRKDCLYDLKSIGYQVGAGFMVGSPFQTIENLVDDLLFIKDLQPEMIGIGPFISHRETPFANFRDGSLDLTLFMLGLLRLMMPNALIPATTALSTIHPKGRELGILYGANVVMPNLSPVGVRKKYLLYDNKISTGEEAAEGRSCLENSMKKIGYEIVVDRGDMQPMESLSS